MLKRLEEDKREAAEERLLADKIAAGASISTFGSMKCTSIPGSNAAGPAPW
jgi:hypothetical protein